MKHGASMMTREGGIHLSVDIRVEAADLALWNPITVRALMDGIASILHEQQQARSARDGAK